MDYDKLYKNKNTVYFSHSRPELLKYIPANTRCILDIGCGSGSFGELVQKKIGCEVWGVEPDKVSCLAAKQKLNWVYNGFFDDQALNVINRTFDCIFFNDVLEHLIDPDDALKKAKLLLNPGGYIIASIPNIRFFPVLSSLLFEEDFKYVDAGVLDKTHLRFYTKKSMIRLFEECGLKVVTIEGINPEGFLFVRIGKYISRKKIGDMMYPQFAVVSQNL